MSKAPIKIIEYKNGSNEGQEVNIENFGKKFKLMEKKSTDEIRELILNLQKRNK